MLRTECIAIALWTALIGWLIIGRYWLPRYRCTFNVKRILLENLENLKINMHKFCFSSVLMWAIISESPWIWGYWRFIFMTCLLISTALQTGHHHWLKFLLFLKTVSTRFSDSLLSVYKTNTEVGKMVFYSYAPENVWYLSSSSFE